MDEVFQKKLSEIAQWNEIEEEGKESSFDAQFSNKTSGLLRLQSDKGSFDYELKPLMELYATTPQEPSQRHEFSLLMTIEGAIKRFFQENPDLKDSDVISLLESLSLKPEAVPSHSSIQYPLWMDIDSNLRLQLSMRPYTRHEIRQAIRKILRSAKRHNQQQGERGYLTFISIYVP